jgi:hypothetical protein
MFISKNLEEAKKRGGLISNTTISKLKNVR